MSQHKNIVLLIADDLGRNVSCYGATACQTPHLDHLAAEGTRFDMAFTSTASCSPSRTVIYTGLHGHESGQYGLAGERNHFQTFAKVETAPRLFNEAGYQTGIIGKLHVGPDSVYPWQLREESESRDVAWVADRAEAFFQRAKSVDKPFFLTVGYIDPHRVMGERAGFGNMDADGEKGGYDARIKDVKYDPADVEIPPFLSDLPEVRVELAEYYRAIHRMDQGVGLIMDALARLNLTESTMVIFLSDNGPPFLNSKTTLYDAGVRLPLLIRQPGGPRGTVNPNLVSYIDLLPTLLDWAGQSHRKGVRRGRSILPILGAREDLPGWDHVFGSHTLHEITNYWPTRFMRDRRYKYHRNFAWQLQFPFATDLYCSLTWEGVRNAAPLADDIMIGPRPLKNYISRPAEELYDLEADPDEVHNLAGNAAHEDMLREMRAALEHWQLLTGDPFVFRDGVSITHIKQIYFDIGTMMRIPDRFELDIERPGNKDDVPVVTFAEDGTFKSALH